MSIGIYIQISPSRASSPLLILRLRRTSSESMFFDNVGSDISLVTCFELGNHFRAEENV